MVNYEIQNLNEELLTKKFPFYTLGIDVGGTHTNLAIAGIENQKPKLLYILDFKTQELDSLASAVEETLNYNKNYDIEINNTCIGAAGVVSPNNEFAELTNVKWNINLKELLEQTSLESAFIINDFQTIGYGINLLDLNNENDIFEVRADKNITGSKTTKAIIGAGTGLGKCILVYHENYNAFVPIASEGGHSDFPAQDNYETELLQFIKKQKELSQPVIYEELLSGRGLENIYKFIRNTQRFNSTNIADEIDSNIDKIPLISKYKTMDETCRETFRLFTKFYARCAKNFVLDTMATGGLYIAGGIAAKNKEIFTSEEFITEFENAYQRSNVLKNIPIYVITNYYVSLYGACYAAMLKSEKIMSC
jgi:glucokinase